MSVCLDTRLPVLVLPPRPLPLGPAGVSVERLGAPALEVPRWTGRTSSVFVIIAIFVTNKKKKRKTTIETPCWCCLRCTEKLPTAVEHRMGLSRLQGEAHNCQ